MSRLSLVSGWAMLTLIAAVCGSRTASSALIASDDFESYALGSINGQGSSGGGWAGAYGGDSNSDILRDVVSGAIPGYGKSLALGRASGSGVFTRNSALLREFASQNSDNLYVGFVLQGSDAGDAADDFMQLYVNNLSGASTQGTSYSGGVETASFFAREGGEDQVYGSTAYASDTLYQVVLKISKSVPGVGNDYDSAAIYINQSTESSPDVVVGPGSVSPLADLSYLHFRLSSLEAGDTFYIDNLRIATTYAEAIPEPMGLSMIVTGLSLLGFNYRRRRQVMA